MNIGERVKTLRINKKMSQSDLASKLGYSQQMVGMIERGERELSIQKLIEMIDIFKVSSDYLLGIKKEEEKLSVVTVKERAEVV